jgi:hypothetical protein
MKLWTPSAPRFTPHARQRSGRATAWAAASTVALCGCVNLTPPWAGASGAGGSGGSRQASQVDVEAEAGVDNPENSDAGLVLRDVAAEPESGLVDAGSPDTPPSLGDLAPTTNSGGAAGGTSTGGTTGAGATRRMAATMSPHPPRSTATPTSTPSRRSPRRPGPRLPSRRRRPVATCAISAPPAATPILRRLSSGASAQPVAAPRYLAATTRSSILPPRSPQKRAASWSARKMPPTATTVR